MAHRLTPPEETPAENYLDRRHQLPARLRRALLRPLTPERCAEIDAVLARLRELIRSARAAYERRTGRRVKVQPPADPPLDLESAVPP